MWIRFWGGTGTRLIDEPVEPFRCGTQGAGWYAGEYPKETGETTVGEVCYSWPGKSCMWHNMISITECDGFYIFALRAPPACNLRYCII